MPSPPEKFGACLALRSSIEDSCSMSYLKKARMSLHAAANVLMNDDSEWFDSEADDDDELDFSELADPLTIAQNHAEHITGEKIQNAIQVQTCKFIVGLAIYTYFRAWS